MSIKPILFNSEMVRALLNDRKHATRRILKPQPEHVRVCMGLSEIKGAFEFACDGPTVFCKTPFMPGDILWVRETFDKVPVSADGKLHPGHSYWYYKADGDLRPPSWHGGWTPSIHMPKEAARIFLRVTKVWAERLQDIDFDGAVAEGVDPMDITPCVPAYPNYPGVDMDAVVGYEQECEQRRLIGRHFGNEIWDDTVKPSDLALYGWAANPWVSVTEFERLDSPPKCFFADSDTGEYGDSPILAPAT